MKSSRLHALVPLAIAMAVVEPASAATYTWNNVTGDWMVGGNWTPGGPPGAGDTAVVNISNPQLAADTTILGLTQGGGNISGIGNLTVTGPSTWTAGTQSGTGSTTFGDTLAVSGTGNKVISGGRIVTLNGATTWSGNTGANNVISFATGTLNNNGTFSDQNTFATSLAHSSGTNAFNNNATYNKDGNTVTTASVVFNNAGTLNINAGSMYMTASTHTGTINIANGASIEFRNGTNLLDDVTLTGAGTLIVSTDNVGADGIVTINGGTLNSAFLLSGGSIRGTDQTFQGAATWTGGAISGPASTTFGNALTISGTNTKTISGGRTVNAGNTSWTGNTGANNSIALTGGSVFNSAGTFTDANGFDSSMSGGTFNNAGTFDKQSATTTSMGSVFNNTGTANVNAGTLLMNGGGTSTGVFNIADGAKLEFRNGSHTLNNVTTSGAGTFQISTENVGADATAAVNGGTHTTLFLLSGSTMTGTDATFQGAATWTGGAISGAASTTFANDVTISGAGTKSMVGGRTVNLQGTTTWTGNTANNDNAIRFWNGATLNNNGTFNDDNAFDSFIEHNVGGPHNFNNVGTYNKNANTTTNVDLGVNFNNTGNVNVNAGTMHVNNATDNLGTITTAAGTTFGTGGGANFQNHGILQGHGTYDPFSGRAVLNAGEVRPGTSTTVGALTVDGDYTQTATGIFEVNLAALTNFDSMNVVNGNLALDGLLRVTSLGDYNPVLGDSFNIITFDDGVTDPGDLAGTFASLTATGFHPSVLFDVLYFDHSVVLTVTASAVPAPAAAWLFGTALAGGLLRARRRRT